MNLAAIRGLMIDMDGVLWRAGEPIGPLPAWFARLKALGLRWVFVTNNATKTPEDYVRTLRRLGLKEAEASQVVNSVQAAVFALRSRWPQGGRVYVIGEEGLYRGLAEAGFEHSEALEGVLAVVVGLDRRLTYEKLAHATLLIRRGAWFVGTNPDRSFPTPQGLVPGAGAILAALEAASDVQATVVGKPAPFLFRVAISRLGLPPEQILVVGDRLETDILGGQRVGCPTALVLSGVTTRDQAKAWSPPPDLIAEDFGAVIARLEQARRGPEVL